MNTLITLLILIGIFALQIFLSRAESKWLGLVIPIICFLYGLLYPLNMMAPIGGATAQFYIQMLAVWVMGNIPTLIFQTIYFVCRKGKKRNKSIDKMNIQDLD